MLNVLQNISILFAVIVVLVCHCPNGAPLFLIRLVLSLSLVLSVSYRPINILKIWRHRAWLRVWYMCWCGIHLLTEFSPIYSSISSMKASAHWEKSSNSTDTDRVWFENQHRHYALCNHVSTTIRSKFSSWLFWFWWRRDTYDVCSKWERIFQFQTKAKITEFHCWVRVAFTETLFDLLRHERHCRRRQYRIESRRIWESELIALALR